MDIGPRYNPAEHEQSIYQFWEKRGYFHGAVNPGKPKFSVVIPPPNITGILTMGHVMDNTPQDILVRFKRKQGFVTTWIPGTDHAGIATQNVLRRELEAQGLSLGALGREKFLDRVWQWKEKFGGRIIEQLQRMGCSCDWKRTRFTMDEGLSRAVTEAFCRLHEKGLLYRGDYIVNWCPRCGTALSDDEVERADTEGFLWDIHYPLKNSTERVTVATTRPETMLGDTALAVHPEDPRYRNLVGKSAILPVIGRELPIVADRFVDPKFGTGIVKVTPAHDPNDFLIAQRHSLPSVRVMTPEARMNENAGKYTGQDRYECRKNLLEDLKSQGLLGATKKHVLALGHCYRCEQVIEPTLSKQWFVRMKPLAERAAKAAQDGSLQFFPERWKSDFLSWMENIRDWCVSRQLWWGHRIPAWHCAGCQGITVSRTTPAACAECQSDRIRQDEDVLDTWFSSWLWPFSTLGWPEKTPELEYFYPTDWLNSGKDILFFWDARMVMAGLEFTGKLPFPCLYLHGIARDAQGRKLSKSLGNSPDPLEMFDRYGADAVRFGIMANTPIGQDVLLSEKVYELGRNFVTKLWNAARLVTLKFDSIAPEELGPEPTIDPAKLTEAKVEDRWMLSRLEAAIEQTTEALERYDFSEAAHTLHRCLWNEFCDWYLESIKDRFQNPGVPDTRLSALCVSWKTLLDVIGLLHPIIPFVTEVLWQKLREVLPWGSKLCESIVIAPWPKADKRLRDTVLESETKEPIEVVGKIREIQKSHQIPSNTARATVSAASEEDKERIYRYANFIGKIAKLRRKPQNPDAFDLEIGTRLPKPQEFSSAPAVVGPFEIRVVPGEKAGLTPEREILEHERDRVRLERETKKLEQQIEALKADLDRPGLRQRAPINVIRAKETRLADLLQQLAKIQESLRDLGFS